jgi:hypothetical protein
MDEQVSKSMVASCYWQKLQGQCSDADTLTGWRSHKLLFKRDKSAQFMERSILTQKAILRITSVIALGLSSILPLCSILVLNTVQKASVRLGIITAFTVIFSLSLGLVTGARRVEIFSAAAAYVCYGHVALRLTWNRYAAVQVVFIAGNGPSPVPENHS